MYPYHNKIKQRIRNGELTGWHFTDNYPRIGPALVLQFSTYPPLRPIRPRRRGGGIEKAEQCGAEHPTAVCVKGENDDVG